VVARFSTRAEACRALRAAGMQWDQRLCRFVARLDGVRFPITSRREHLRAASLVRAVLAA
jgi:hypothetical protein